MAKIPKLGRVILAREHDEESDTYYVERRVGR